MPNVFFCVKSAPRATAEERSTSRVDDLFFSASVEAPPTQDSRVLNKGCCLRSGRGSLRGNEPPGVNPHAGWRG
jgi:hypothetical protein